MEMIEVIKNTVIQQMIQSFSKKHGLEILHFLPGRIRVKILDWKSREEKLNSLLKEMESDPDISSVSFTPETGTLLVTFRKEAIADKDSLRRWKNVAKKYDEGVMI